jgi:fused signal recognition particle receptor
LEAAIKRGHDVLIIDTAGRLHTRENLMEELKKTKRVLDKKMPGTPHEVLLVLDATIGQNAIEQTRQFNNALGVTGIVLTKMDGSSKGGVIVGIADEFDIPIRFVGVGEAMDDLQEFDALHFVDALFKNTVD